MNDVTGRISKPEIFNLKHLRSSKLTKEFVRKLVNDHARKRDPCYDEAGYDHENGLTFNGEPGV